MKFNSKGAASPDVRSVSMGVFPIQAIKSNVCDTDVEVSHDLTNEMSYQILARIFSSSGIISLTLSFYQTVVFCLRFLNLAKRTNFFVQF